MRDIAFGLRLLWKEKGFTAAAVLTIALCIGANTAIFTVLDTVVLRDLPFPQSDRLVTLYNVYPGVGVDEGSNAVPDYLDRRKMRDVFSEVALYRHAGFDMGAAGSTQRIDAEAVTPSYFQVLQVQAIAGRGFTEDEGRQGDEKVAILTEGLWKEMFARNPAVIGTDIRLDGQPYRVVGVMPDRAALLSRDARLWVPLAFSPQQMSDDARHSNSWEMVARLKPGITVEYAKKRIDALNAANIERFPQYKELLLTARFATKVLDLKGEMVRQIGPTLLLLQIAVLVVLAIGCVNMANLMLVRSNVRMKELAIRFSLGAGRWRIVRQLLIESLTLAALGAAIGVGLAHGGVRLLSTLGAKDLPRGSTLHIDARVLLVTAAVAIATGLLFGSVPILHLLRQDLNEVFRGKERGGTAARRAVSVRSVLVGAQVSLAFVLLMGAGLLTLTFYRLLAVRPGFNGEGVMTVRVALPESRYKDDAAKRAFLARVRDSMTALPAVRYSGATTFLPFGNDRNASLIHIVGRPATPGDLPPVPGWNYIDSGYLPAMGIPIIRGRNIAASDGVDAPKVCLIDEFLVRKYWPKTDPIGAEIQLGDGSDSKAPKFTIVGIAGSVKVASLSERNVLGTIYFSNQQMTSPFHYFVVRTQRDDPQLISAIRRQVSQIDPELAIFDTKTMPQRIAESLVNQRAAMVLCMMFGGLALLLAAVGIYGVLAYSVTQRTREIGIRSAIGAQPRDILGMVIGQGLKVSVAGLVIGAVAAFALTRLMASLLYGVKPADPIVFAGAAVALGAAALIASAIPSIRAVRIEPATALRYE